MRRPPRLSRTVARPEAGRADAGATNEEGRTPRQWLEERGLDEITTLVSAGPVRWMPPWPAIQSLAVPAATFRDVDSTE
jgi:hypothetical protein